MITSSIKSGIILTTTAAFMPSPIAILMCIIYLLYFASMLKMNVVNTLYKGRWSLYFKSFITYFKKK